VDSTANIRDALQTLHENTILSLPVINSSTSPPVVIGFLDMFDILAYLLEVWDGTMKSSTSHPEKILSQLFLLEQQFLHHCIADLPDRSDNDIFAAVIEEEKASRLLRLYGLGVHRVALVNMQGDINHVASQSDLIKFLNSNSHLLGEYSNKTVKELGLISEGELIVIDNEQPAIKGFRVLAMNNISAAPVVNAQGSLLGTLSVSDLRALRRENLSSLLQPVKHYKDIGEKNTINIVCRPSETLSGVLALLAGTHIHRVWITNESNKPVSVISLTTICDFMATICGVVQ